MKNQTSKKQEPKKESKQMVDSKGLSTLEWDLVKGGLIIITETGGYGSQNYSYHIKDIASQNLYFILKTDPNKFKFKALSILYPSNYITNSLQYNGNFQTYVIGVNENDGLMWFRSENIKWLKID